MQPMSTPTAAPVQDCAHALRFAQEGADGIALLLSTLTAQE